MIDNNLINNNLINWIQKVIHLKISKKLILDFNIEKSIWIIKISDSEKSIKIPLIKNLYKIGYAGKLRNSLWDSGNEGFFLTENFIQMPGKEQAEKIIKIEENFIQINYDILGLTYWMLCRCEEINPNKSILDKHNRFPSKASHSFLNNYLNRPIIDEWHMVLREITLLLWPGIKLVNLKFQLILSHDVDRPSSYLFISNKKFLYNSASALKRNKNFIEFLRQSKNRYLKKSFIDKKDTYNSFEKIMDISEKYSLKSTFNFMTGGKHIVDGHYKIKAPGIIRLIKNIIQRGHEIGIHPSYDSCKNNTISEETNLLREALTENKIDYEINSSRMHYLRYKIEKTPNSLCEAGIKYDSTLGYSDNIGFRCGTSFEYPMFDPINQKEIGMNQLPLLAMEDAVLYKEYKGFEYTPEALNSFLEIKNKCKFVDGNFTLLWHNCHFNNLKDWEFYNDIINL